VLDAEVRAQAAGRVTDPDDALALLGDLSRFVGDDGKPDRGAIVAAVDDLVAAKPYLARRAHAGTADQGVRGPSAPPSSSDWLRDTLRGRPRV
jgi:hypothetical protein